MLLERNPTPDERRELVWNFRQDWKELGGTLMVQTSRELRTLDQSDWLWSRAMARST